MAGRVKPQPTYNMVFSGTTITKVPEAAKQEIDRLNAEISELKDRNQDLSVSLSSAIRQMDDLRKEHRDQAAQIDTLRAQKREGQMEMVGHREKSEYWRGMYQGAMALHSQATGGAEPADAHELVRAFGESLRPRRPR